MNALTMNNLLQAQLEKNKTINNKAKRQRFIVILFLIKISQHSHRIQNFKICLKHKGISNKNINNQRLVKKQHTTIK